MAILAGIFSRKNNQTPPPSMCEALKRVMSRNPEDKPTIFSDSQCFLAKIDIGAYGEPAFHVDPHGSMSTLAGESLLNLDGSTSRTRTEDLELLHYSWKKTDWNLLTKTRGVFSAVHYNSSSQSLYLITDKLGVRPLYYWASHEWVIFASALRILESLDEVQKEMDLRALAEMTTLGYPLAERTPYANVVRLRSGQLIKFDEKAINRTHYWRWDDIRESSKTEAEMLTEVYQKFKGAIACRSGKDAETIAMLSGGMDSRSIVTALVEDQVLVHTFNFSRSATQDEVLSSEFARCIGTRHRVGPSLDKLSLSPDANAPWTRALAKAITTSSYRSNSSVERPQLAWSGDGGSVGLGHVYISRQMADLLKDGKQNEAIDLYIKEQKAYVVTRLFQRNVAEKIKEMPREGIIAELDDIHCVDRIRAFHIYLLLNDQRRHLDGHYEDIDIHRIEFHLPFFDSNFLRSVLAVPSDLCILHRFYTKWMSQFPPVINAVPWQTYPGHEPCPLPITSALEYQWNSGRTAAWSLSPAHRPRWLKMVRETLVAEDFPSGILRKRYLWFEKLAYQAGLRKDVEYAFKVAKTVHKYWSVCQRNRG